MGNKKKRNHPDMEEILSRPWCYYCERDFDDLKILISHQKARHFKCERCGRRLNTAGGLSVHMSQVHKETLSSVENALPNRSGLDVEIFGMEGIPEDIVQSHNQRILGQFHQVNFDRQSLTGNAGPGSHGGVPAHKKPKHESVADIKKRLAEHKARKAAEHAAGTSSASPTPLSSTQDGQSPVVSQSPVTYAGSPQFQSQQPFTSSVPSPSIPAYPMPYGQQNVPQQSTFNQVSAAYMSPGVQSYAGSTPQYAGAQQYPPGSQALPMQYPPAYAPNTHTFGPASPSTAHQPYPQNRANSPPQNASLPHRPGSLPPAPGLPQRPMFNAPQINTFQMQKIHQGQLPGNTNLTPTTSYIPNQASGHNVMSNEANGQGHSAPRTPTAEIFQQAPGTTTESLQIKAAVEDLVAGAKSDRDVGKKNDKKHHRKDKATRLVYKDNDESPEEKMAKLPRYAFAPTGKPEMVLGNAVESAIVNSINNGIIAS